MTLHGDSAIFHSLYTYMLPCGRVTLHVITYISFKDPSIYLKFNKGSSQYVYPCHSIGTSDLDRWSSAPSPPTRMLVPLGNNLSALAQVLQVTLYSLFSLILCPAAMSSHESSVFTILFFFKEVLFENQSQIFQLSYIGEHWPNQWSEIRRDSAFLQPVVSCITFIVPRLQCNERFDWLMPGQHFTMYKSTFIYWPARQRCVKYTGCPLFMTSSTVWKLEIHAVDYEFHETCHSVTF